MRPPIYTPHYSSAASGVYKGQQQLDAPVVPDADGPDAPDADRMQPGRADLRTRTQPHQRMMTATVKPKLLGLPLYRWRVKYRRKRQKEEGSLLLLRMLLRMHPWTRRKSSRYVARCPRPLDLFWLRDDVDSCCTGSMVSMT